MAYKKPLTPLTCRITKAPSASPPVGDVVTTCGLTRALLHSPRSTAEDPIVVDPLLCMNFPAGTDVRDGTDNIDLSADQVECPAGSGCLYRVVWVWDQAKGFPNEARFAFVQHYSTNFGLGGPRP